MLLKRAGSFLVLLPHFRVCSVAPPRPRTSGRSWKFAAASWIAGITSFAAVRAVRPAGTLATTIRA